MGGGGVYTVPPSPSAHVKIKDALSAITSFGYIVCSKSACGICRKQFTMHEFNPNLRLQFIVLVIETEEKPFIDSTVKLARTYLRVKCGGTTPYTE